MKKIVLATTNKGKIKEFKQILSDFIIVPMAEAGFVGEIEETGKTFRENAYIKAKTVADALGVAALADDSGLIVNSLNGAPGVYSARYSIEGTDEKNRELLLKNLQGVTDRSAEFICVLAYVEPNGKTIFAEGRTQGEILYSEQGSCGFGYDPVFYSTDLKKSMGEATPQEKNSVSHRARAIYEIKDKL